MEDSLNVDSLILDKFNDGRFTLKSSLVNLSLQIFTLKYSLANQCIVKVGERVVPQKAIIVLLTVLLSFQNGGEMEDKISMSQRALPKVTSQRYLLSQRYIPNNVRFKKRNRLHFMISASLRLGPGKERSHTAYTFRRKVSKLPTCNLNRF